MDRIDERRHAVQPRRQHLALALDQHTGDVVGRLRIGVLAPWRRSRRCRRARSGRRCAPPRRRLPAACCGRRGSGIRASTPRATKRLALEAAHRRGHVRIVDAHPRLEVEPERQAGQQAPAPLEDVLVAGAGPLRRVGAAAHDRAEVEHVVLHPPLAVGRLEHVEAVQAARVVVVQPRREDAVAAQLAPVLVREDVVRIVGTLAVVAEAAERRAVGEAARRATRTRPSGRRAARASTSSRSRRVNGRTPAGIVDVAYPRVRGNLDPRRIDVGRRRPRPRGSRARGRSPCRSPRRADAISGLDGGSNSICQRCRSGSMTR